MSNDSLIPKLSWKYKCLFLRYKLLRAGKKKAENIMYQVVLIRYHNGYYFVPSNILYGNVILLHKMHQRKGLWCSLTTSKVFLLQVTGIIIENNKIWRKNNAFTVSVLGIQYFLDNLNIIHLHLCIAELGLPLGRKWMNETLLLLVLSPISSMERSSFLNPSFIRAIKHCTTTPRSFFFSLFHL